MKIFKLAGIIAILIIGATWYWMRQSSALPVQAVTDYENATYVIEGKPIKLLGGRAESASVPGSTSKIVTTIFGPATIGDLNNDGNPDAVTLLTQSAGGSGTFFYVGAALNQVDSRMVGNTFLLGDRIAPQNIEIREGLIIVNYAERNPGEPMTARPSLGVSKYLRLIGTLLEEVPAPSLIERW